MLRTAMGTAMLLTGVGLGLRLRRQFGQRLRLRLHRRQRLRLRRRQRLAPGAVALRAALRETEPVATHAASAFATRAFYRMRMRLVMPGLVRHVRQNRTGTCHARKQRAPKDVFFHFP